MISHGHLTRVAAWAAAGVLTAGAAGVGIAYAADPSPSPTASSSGSATPDGTDRPDRPGRADQPGQPGQAGRGRHDRAAHRALVGHGPLARRLMHGEVVVKGKDGTPTTVDVQRGKVTAVSASSITVRSSDGFTATYAVTSNTRVRINEKGATSAQIGDGDTASVTAHKSGDTSTAQAMIVGQ